MSNTSKAIIWIVIIVVIIIAGGIWWWNSSQTPSSPAAAPSATTQNESPTQAPPVQTNATSTGNGVSATDNSDASLNQDLSNIDGQMNGLSSDSASINQGLNDQPVQQGQ